MPLVIKPTVTKQAPVQDKQVERVLPEAQFPLTGLTLTFDTTTDDKDSDTVVSVSIDNHATLMGAGNVGGGSHWGNNTTATVSLPIANAVDFSACDNGHMNITIHPNGHDTWNFNVTLKMDFVGGAWRKVSWPGISLAQDRPSIDLTWHP